MQDGAPNHPRTFGLLDHAALWASLGVSLYIMPFGSRLVPALSLGEALGAVVVAAILGSLLLAGGDAVRAVDGEDDAEVAPTHG